MELTQFHVLRILEYGICDSLNKQRQLGVKPAFCPPPIFAPISPLFARLGPVMSQTMLATSWRAARKFRAVFSYRVAIARKLLDLGEEILDQMARRIKLSVVVAR